MIDLSLYTDLYALLIDLLKGFLGIFLFAFCYKKRSRFALRFLLSALLGAGLCALLSYAKYLTGPQLRDSLQLRFFIRILVKLFQLGVLFFCYRENVAETLLCWCMVFAVGAFIGDSYSLLLNLCGVNDKLTVSFFKDFVRWRDFGLLGLYHVGLFCLFFVLFSRRVKIRPDRNTTLWIALIGLCTLVFNQTLSTYSRQFEDMVSAPGVTVSLKGFSVALNLMTIVLCLFVERRNKLSQDLEITELLLQQQKRQYETSRENVEAINMKCHDLKHRLTDLEDRLNEEQLQSLREAIELYDTNIRTGSPILDVVLYEKQLLCRRYGIRFSCLTDGKLLSFMSPSHVYSLVGNALDNAIEAAKDLEDSKKLIDFSLSALDGSAVMEVSNYFDGSLQKDGDLPATTKGKSSLHGFGMKSMRFVADRYCGNLTYTAEGGMFLLRIELPLQQKGQK